ncbi:MAG: hypothetical protein K0S84_1705, partial [Nitrososphaera sp.]|nr:hypothetical protein [Nitrososphaera sp.]
YVRQREIMIMMTMMMPILFKRLNKLPSQKLQCTPGVVLY